MVVRALDDKLSDTLVVVSGEGFWTGSSTLPHLHQIRRAAVPRPSPGRTQSWRLRTWYRTTVLGAFASGRDWYSSSCAPTIS